MVSNPHSDFTTHNHTLPTLSNLPIFATVGDNLLKVLNKILTISICTQYIGPGLHYKT